ncbi:MAG: hypothetical protein RLZZ241_596 [Bacteroidota bacterium]
MKIEHLALWVADLEGMRDFYVNYFKASANDLYHNPKTGFQSYFLSFEAGPRIEIMFRPDIAFKSDTEQLGYAHFAVAVGNKEYVISLTERLRQDGFLVCSEPRTTGDGYFESVIKDPEGNRIEITI